MGKELFPQFLRRYFHLLLAVFISFAAASTASPLEGPQGAAGEAAVQRTSQAKTRGEKIVLGRWDEHAIDEMAKTGSQISDSGERIRFISNQFLDTPYGEHTLVGSVNRKELLVVDLARMDCFTYLDYVEALRISGGFKEFERNLKLVRYRGGVVDYTKRNHFFTDWAAHSAGRIEDITREVGRSKAKSVKKILNLKADGTRFLQGIPTSEREITFIPGDAVDATVIGRLKTGDYIGVYTPTAGLDVSHTGIFIRKGDEEGEEEGEGEAVFRHASSRKSTKRVVDNDFKDYFSDKPGFIVLRAR